MSEPGRDGGTVRLNRAIERLVRGEPVLAAACIPTGSVEAAVAVASGDYDAVIFDMEHQWFEPNQLRVSLQFLLDRARIAGTGSLQAAPVPLVRVPTNAGEQSQWIFKQVLDAGVFGIVVPQLETVEAALAAVAACRYPQVMGAADAVPLGRRGYWTRQAPRYWGLPTSEYHRRADLWPLDPEGELLLVPIVETVAGMAKLADILPEVPGIGAIWVGSGDLSVSLGLGGDQNDPRLEEAELEILKICRDFNVPCGCNAWPGNIERRLAQGFQILMTVPHQADAGNLAARQALNR
jgi:4-hydroxy-2-oxoheptanedioate aldolase